MGLSRRVQKLEAAIPPIRSARPVPTDPVAFARGLLAGTFGLDDLDPTDPYQTGWLVRLHAFLGTLSPGHQAWLQRARESDPGAYPGDLLLPAPEAAIHTALDAVMRRG